MAVVIGHGVVAEVQHDDELAIRLVKTRGLMNWGRIYRTVPRTIIPLPYLTL